VSVVEAQDPDGLVPRRDDDQGCVGDADIQVTVAVDDPAGGGDVSGVEVDQLIRTVSDFIKEFACG
jgi:hypothetical protein